MISSRKCQVAIALIIACITLPVLVAEPNEPRTELKFGISSENSQRWINSRGQGVTGPIRPSHVAEFFLKGAKSNIYISDNKGITFIQKPWDFPTNEDIKMMLQTTAGRSVSQKQHKFITTSNAFIVRMDLDKKIRYYRKYCLYAVSEMDAKKMVEAFVEVFTEKANATMQKNNEALHNARGKIVHIKEILPEKEDQAKAAELKFKEVKDARYSLLTDTEAKKRAKETMLDMDKTLDVLEIELAGIKEKIQSIQQFRRMKSMDGHDFSKETLNKLEQMLVGQMIELRSAEARKEASLRIRNQEKAILDCFNRWTSLDEEAKRLKRDIEEYKSDINRIEYIMANPSPEMLPPEIYQNKVTIFPVLAEQS